MPTIERTSSEWYAAAERCHLEGHQACAWCGNAHQVLKTVTEHGVEFQCIFCDFLARYDESTNRFSIIPGERIERTGAQATMHEI